MKSLASYLLVMFMVMFWIFRIVVAFTFEFGIDIGFTPFSMNMEIILLFVAFFCIILIVKRKLLGAIIYLIAYGGYFGVDLFNWVMAMLKGETVEVSSYTNLFASFIAIVLTLSVLFELLFDKNRKTHPVDKKTDWFYKNKQFDRKLDERADKNNYRTM